MLYVSLNVIDITYLYFHFISLNEIDEFDLDEKEPNWFELEINNNILV